MLTKVVCAVRAQSPSRGQHRAASFWVVICSVTCSWGEVGVTCAADTEGRKHSNITLCPHPHIHQDMNENIMFLPSLVPESQEVDILVPGRLSPRKQSIKHWSFGLILMVLNLRSACLKRKKSMQVRGKCLFYKHLFLRLLLD